MEAEKVSPESEENDARIARITKEYEQYRHTQYPAGGVNSDVLFLLDIIKKLLAR